MKKLDDVLVEIKELIATDTKELKKGAVNKMRKRVEFLEVVRNYLEGSPSEEFVAKEKSRIDGIVTKIKDGFQAWIVWNEDKGEAYKEQRDYYEKEMELKKYKTQFKALDFILS